MGVAVSSSHVVSAAPSSSGAGLLTLLPCSSVGSLSWGSALHELLQRESFPQVAVLHKLLQRGLSHGVTAFSGPSHLLRRGVLHGLQGNLCSPVKPPWAVGGQPAVSPQAAGQSLLRRTSSLSFFTDLAVCRVVSLTSHSSLCCSSFLFSSLSPSSICSHRGTTTIAEWLGLAQRWVRLGAGEASSSFAQRPPL